MMTITAPIWLWVALWLVAAGGWHLALSFTFPQWHRSARRLASMVWPVSALFVGTLGVLGWWLERRES